MTNHHQSSESKKSSVTLSIEEASAIAQVNQKLNCDLRWQRMDHCGSSNSLLTAVLDDQRLVLRCNATGRQAFGVNRNTEAEILQLIQSYDWAPRVLLMDEQLRWCLMKDHGVSLKQPLPIEAYNALLHSLRQWQSVWGGPEFNYMELFTRYRRQLQRKQDRDGLLLLAKIEQVQAGLSPVQRCLTHHDLHGGNLCWNDGVLVVLDWEYAGIGNPWFDAAGLYRYLTVPMTDIQQLPAWENMSVSEFQSGMSQAIWISEALDLLWYCVRDWESDNRRNVEIQALLARAGELS